VDEDCSVEQMLDTMGDSYARQILAALSEESRPAKALAETCDISLPTVYRRLDQLETHDLVTSHTEVDENGNEFKLYDCNFESTVISLDDEYEYDVRIYRRQNLPGRFSQLWDELQVE
jgi:predicted transcriptional regulator